MKINPTGNLQSMLEKDPDSVYFVSTASCRPCKMLRPIIDSNEFKEVFVDASLYQPHINKDTEYLVRDLQRLNHFTYVPRLYVFKGGVFVGFYGGLIEIAEYLGTICVNERLNIPDPQTAAAIAHWQRRAELDKNKIKEKK
jgi:hypothetical protein